MSLIYEKEMDQIYDCLNADDFPGAYSILGRQTRRRAQKHREEIQVLAERVLG